MEKQRSISYERMKIWALEKQRISCKLYKSTFLKYFKIFIFFIQYILILQKFEITADLMKWRTWVSFHISRFLLFKMVIHNWELYGLKNKSYFYK